MQSAESDGIFWVEGIKNGLSYKAIYWQQRMNFWSKNSQLFPFQLTPTLMATSVEEKDGWMDGFPSGLGTWYQNLAVHVGE